MSEFYDGPDHEMVELALTVEVGSYKFFYELNGPIALLFHFKVLTYLYIPDRFFSDKVSVIINQLLPDYHPCQTIKIEVIYINTMISDKL